MSILDKIVTDTRELVKKRKSQSPVTALKAMPLYSAPTRSFFDALQTPSLAFITEIKKASPSKGVIREDFNPTWIARRYSQSGASAISVLTEPLYFQGALGYLSEVRSVTQCPLLRKDFIVDTYQVHEARAYGADAILLIAAVLEKQQLFDLHQAANELGMDCLVELYEAEEIDRVDFDQVRILGVNNRDLRTFEVDLTHSTRIFNDCPDSTLKVSESGINTVEDLLFLCKHNVDAVLIGESLMRSKDPGDKLQALKESIQDKGHDKSNLEQTV